MLFEENRLSASTAGIILNNPCFLYQNEHIFTGFDLL